MHLLVTPEGRSLLPRAAAGVVAQVLEIFPVVVVTGPRQTGKSTLVRDLMADPDRAYVTLDDLAVLGQAMEEPDALVRRAARMTIDEVQRVPELLLSIKRLVDEERTPGRFILTGSANLHLMKSVSDSLAGRAVYLTLRGMTRSELSGKGGVGKWEVFLDEPREAWPGLIKADPGRAESWEAECRRGGLPVPALELDEPGARRLWYDGYVRTYLERDLQDLSQVASLPDFRRLLQATALRIGNPQSQADLARDVGLPPSTAQRYLGLMEASHQLLRVPPYSVNRTKRLVKSPKLYWSDVGLALHLSGEEMPRGCHLENLVLLDLLAWQDTRSRRPELLYWRTSKGAEVDFVIESERGVLPIEVKSSARIRTKDLRHLRVFMGEYPDVCSVGLVLHTGHEVYWASDGILAAPWWSVL